MVGAAESPACVDALNRKAEAIDKLHPRWGCFLLSGQDGCRKLALPVSDWHVLERGQLALFGNTKEQSLAPGLARRSTLAIPNLGMGLMPAVSPGKPSVWPGLLVLMCLCAAVRTTATISGSPICSRFQGADSIDLRRLRIPLSVLCISTFIFQPRTPL